MLLVDARRETTAADGAFAQAWDRWYVEHPAVDHPPALAVLSGIDAPDLGGDWKPPYNWESGQGARETAARARLNSLRAALPPSFTALVPVALHESLPFGAGELLLPALIAQLHRAERSALIRHFRRVSSRSKARRLISQVGGHGVSLWKNLRSRGKPAAPEHL